MAGGLEKSSGAFAMSAAATCAAFRELSLPRGDGATGRWPVDLKCPPDDGGSDEKPRKPKASAYFFMLSSFAMKAEGPPST